MQRQYYTIPYGGPFNHYGYNPYQHLYQFHQHGGQSFVPLTGNFAGGHFSGTGGFAAAPHIGVPSIGHVGGAGFAGVHVRQGY